ncbi:CCA tRNA nucleotidyltransferase [Methanofollis fontis]|uniref:CCA-adding enzyme n=1 Tax=Methanofollis fontis TaxID=2052832 RepID=A0A483CVD4_9EURY|nr:CCA tRNA nucleotidyltransferase [Methanofollis fontis]TAJ44937.1 CCA tRNA nucleotidyltransferase [Methanofollis fontis]
MRTDAEKEALQRIRPLTDEYDEILGVAARIKEEVNSSGIAEAMLVGSVARGTWVRGDRDLDIFMLFDPALSREELEEKGLGLARRVADRLGDEWREKYAEHPYINATINGLDVDLVPCYRVASGAEIRSAVDRTPFHTRYIRERIAPFVDDVLLFKQFAKAGGVYGSDQMTEGFAGYLCELLILHYGGFTPLIRAATHWKPGLLIDIEGHASRAFDEPMVVVDPVDPKRNVAASVSLDQMFAFVELCRGYLDAPSGAFFFPTREEPLSGAAFGEHTGERGTHLYAVTFATPPFIPDVVVPQLRRSLEGIRALLERSGFVVNRASEAMGEERCILLFELFCDEMPHIVRHIGPPLWSRANAEKFARKWRESDCFAGPYIENGRYVVEVERRYTRAGDLLASPQMLGVGLGKHVKRAMEQEWVVLRGEECWSPEFAGFLTTFLRKESPLTHLVRSGQA